MRCLQLSTLVVFACLHTSVADTIKHPIHRHLPRDVATNETQGLGTVPLTLSSDKQSYYAVVKVGEINFRVALDTASSDLWILSSECTSKTCSSVPRYPRSYQSPTYATVGNGTVQFAAGYADGTVASGYVASEAVQVANLTVPYQAFGMITRSNVTFVDRISGILGLGFPRLSSIPHTVTNSTPFFGALAQQGLIDYPVFGLSLNKNSSGTLAIGAVDSLVVTDLSLISWNTVSDFPPFTNESNVSSYLHWAIPISAFSFNETQLTPLPTYLNTTHNISLALFDVGSPGIYGPYQDVSRLYSMIHGARLVDSSGQWAIPCDTVATISFTFGNGTYRLHPSDYIIGPASGDPNLCLSWPRASPPSADGIDWQLGTPFLRTVYSIYSFGINYKEPPLIGLYPLYNNTAAPETADSISSFLSSASATIATTLPNYLLPTPTYSPMPYEFNTSVRLLSNGIATSGLATSTYIPLLGPQSLFNTSALPTVAPSPTVTTLVVTNSAGLNVTSVSTYTMASVTLGVPPGWNAGSKLHVSCHARVLPVLILSWTLIYIVDILSPL